jgi:hypothetical protein
LQPYIKKWSLYYLYGVASNFYTSYGRTKNHEQVLTFSCKN